MRERAPKPASKWALKGFATETLDTEALLDFNLPHGSVRPNPCVSAPPALAWRRANSTNPFRYFDSSPEVIRLVVLMYVRYSLSLRKV